MRIIGLFYVLTLLAITLITFLFYGHDRNPAINQNTQKPWPLPAAHLGRRYNRCYCRTVLVLAQNKEIEFQSDLYYDNGGTDRISRVVVFKR
jgi:hypothetical protein